MSKFHNSMYDSDSASDTDESNLHPTNKIGFTSKTVKHKVSTKAKARIKHKTSKLNSLPLSIKSSFETRHPEKIKLSKKRKSEEPWTICKRPLKHKKKLVDKSQNNEFFLIDTPIRTLDKSETYSANSTPEKIALLQTSKNKELLDDEEICHLKYNNQIESKSWTGFNNMPEVSTQKRKVADKGQNNEFFLKDTPIQTLDESETYSASSMPEKIASLQTSKNKESSTAVEICHLKYNNQIKSNSWTSFNSMLELSTHKRKVADKSQNSEFFLKDTPIRTLDKSEKCSASSTPENITLLQTSVNKELSDAEEIGHSKYNSQIKSNSQASFNDMPELCECPNTDSCEKSTNGEHSRINTCLAKSCEHCNSSTQRGNKHLVMLHQKCHSAPSCTPFPLVSKPLRRNKLFKRHSQNVTSPAFEFDHTFVSKRFQAYSFPSYDVSKFDNLDNRYIDTHCHIDFLFQREGFKGTFEAYKRMHSDNFPQCYEGCIAIFCDPLTFERKSLWEDLLKEDGIWAAFGCHPHNARNFDSLTEKILKEALKHPRVVALGEIGLDYSSRNSCDVKTQHNVFRIQLKLAVEAKLPIVIHCRNAHDDCIQILKEEVPADYRIHRHCFTGEWKEAEIWLNTFPNLCLGITGLVTFPSAKEVHDVVKRIPLNRLLLETDAPYFVPRHETLKDQKWSRPGMALHVAAQIAALRPEVTIERILLEARKNTYRLYGC